MNDVEFKDHAVLHFDESGFTGNNLLQKEQSVFCYASLECHHEEAKDYVEYILKKYRIQSSEIKGSSLLKGMRGKKAIDEILTKFKGRFKVSVSDKKYALAGKFFEYIFEPAISSANSIFYEINFHKFISNILHLELSTRGEMAEEIFEDFERLMRQGDFSSLNTLFSNSNQNGISPVLEKICAFAMYNKESVIAELDGYIGERSGKWALDLTNTALFSLLAAWGQEYIQLTAYCDQSKPLSEDQSIFEAMINREDRLTSNFSGVNSPITFNLKEPLHLVDSKVVHGIQLADAIAAAFAYLLDKDNQDEYAIKWRDMIEESVIFGSVFNEYDYLDLSKLEVQRNAILLQELVERSREGISLTENIGSYIQWLTIELKKSPLQLK
ncbi:hypothetical protein VH86_02575 [Pantoea sp. BL1]|uniref:DUF3800 domain-containing protein n=1 Tax=Pantoea sp. BL1 TaxID=1628190 RepID=UPI0005F76F1C|nr:DUF3800 domain-containing protein [Pantoea sp. BL1]KJV50065.1 hypothetical protein VH86_02575 [Pantoea sp. BL1]